MLSDDWWEQFHLRPNIQPNQENTFTSINNVIYYIILLSRLVNLLPSQSYPILQYPKNILHGKLLEIQIKLEFEDILHEKPDFKWMPSLEIAEKTSQHLNNVSRSLDRISKRSICTSLQTKLHLLKKISSHDSSFLTQELWNTVKRTIIIKKAPTELKPIRWTEIA
ncbi:hypothetical protein PMAC_000830 [Pneumocystis sp. 'macacae']|nr:hypothetical protein PMAC_000830 [Pneumocystis sp. 'macacae']